MSTTQDTINERVRIVEARRAKHFADATELLAQIEGHRNRATAGYLMGVVSAMTNSQASRAALEAVRAVGLKRALIDNEGITKALEIAMSDGAV